MKYLFYFLFLLVICIACDPNRVYEQNHTIEDNKWYIDSIPNFKFTIQDTTSTYNIYYNVRNAVSYPFYNLYLTYYLLDEQGNLISSRLQDLTLMDAKTGRPLGSGLGDIFDHQILSIPNYKFKRKGTYTFRIKQYMRQDPLPDIMSIGIRVEKAGKTKS
jgi:gliding motility-associated lipoprotein GldH